ncbi:MAG: bifunctional glycosyltransferase/CDP-glycerol:glycerophosphate glycerophosphotransferase [Culicoidibacterales bacterium]
MWRNIFRRIRNCKALKKIKSRLLLKMQSNIKESGTINFSVVTAVYNGEEYIERYFKSILVDNKTYLDRLELVIVDDGSTDGTAKIIRKWKNLYPDNISYIFQVNQGQSMARKNGLKSAKNQWVTFIDSDDFIGENYFTEVNKAIVWSGNKGVISVKTEYFEESSKLESDSHPLKYRFDYGYKYKTVDLAKEPTFFQLAVNCVFIRRDKLIDSGVEMIDLRPQFEDAFFLSEYFLATLEYKITFVNTSVYYYRKRANSSSTLDIAKNDVVRYTELLEKGYYNLLTLFKNRQGFVPIFIQNLVIYDLSWNIKELEESKLFLTHDQQQYREEILVKIFQLIDFSNIKKSWKYFWSLYQIGINHHYYNNQGSTRAGAYYFYENNNDVILELVSYSDNWEIYIGGVKFVIRETEYTMYQEYINNRKLCKRFFIKIPKKNQDKIPEIALYFSGQKVDVANWKKNFKPKKFNEKSTIIFYDRLNKADDNAEVLYDWFVKYKPEYTNIYFAINEASSDFTRLKEKGVNVVNYSSPDFTQLYIDADYILSSGFDKGIENIDGLRYNSFVSRAKFIFLQHGIITDDLSKWFALKRYDKIVISTDFEKKSLLSKYTIFPDQIMQTGLARYDKLKSQPQKIILIAPTWRQKYKNYSVEAFAETEYFNEIKNGLLDTRTNDFLRVNGYKIKLLLHPEVSKYRELFTEMMNPNIMVLNTFDISYQEEISRASIMVTDYSSVVLDFAYLQKPIIYFQKNPKEFFRYHLYTEDLDYRKDGLGVVVSGYDELLETILLLINNDCRQPALYEKRVDKFYKYRDKYNCARIFDELEKM